MKWALIFLSLLFITPAFAGQKYYIQVRASEPTKYGQWNNWNAYEIDDKDVPVILDIVKLDQKKIDEDIQIGVNIWVTERDNPPPVYEPTKEDLEAQKAELLIKSEQLQEKIDAKTAEIIK